MRVEFFTDHYGFVVDYSGSPSGTPQAWTPRSLIAIFHSVRISTHSKDGVKAVRKAVSGLVKLLYPRTVSYLSQSWRNWSRSHWRAGG